MYEKLVILHTANYSRKIRDFFCVDTLIKKGLDVEFWNCGKITVEEHLSPVFSEGLLMVDIESIADFNNQISKHMDKKCLYLSYISYAFYSYELYRTLSYNNVDILYAVSGCMPIQNVETNRRNILNRIKSGSIRNFVRNRYYNYRLSSSQFVPLKYVMESCDVAQADYKVSDETMHIACNSSDYECFRKASPWASDNNKPYSVFIDQYIPYHNDLKLLGKDLISPSDYYNSLNQYFDEYEQHNLCDVIIAAHPSAVEYKNGNPYNGRQIVYNKTAELVKGAISVLAHCSTAISFAVLDYKPIILLTSDFIENYFKYLSIHIHSFNDMIGCDLQNVDHPSAFVGQQVNRTLYDSYRYKLLTTRQAENISNADVIESIVKGTYMSYVR